MIEIDEEFNNPIYEGKLELSNFKKDLKSCPFCGNKPYFRLIAMNINAWRFVEIGCDKCNYKMNIHGRGELEAIKIAKDKWNRRGGDKND